MEIRQKIQYIDSTLKWLRKDGNFMDYNVTLKTVPDYGMAIFHDEGHREHDPDVEIQVSVVGKYEDTEHVKFKTVPPIQTASVTYKGSYEQITRVNEAVANWIVENGYDFNGKSFCIYHVAPNQAASSKDLVTEVCFLVKKK